MVDKASKILVIISHGVLLSFLFMMLFLTGCAQRRVVWQPPSAEALVLDKATAFFYQKWEKTPYRFGGESSRGIDCSSFMQKAYSTLYNIDLPRTTRQQMRMGYKISPNALEKGDLLFFRTGRKSYHVGMYLGAKRFLHAGETTGVTITKLDNSDPGNYWRKHYLEAHRLPGVR